MQSLYFRFFVDNAPGVDATAGRVVLPAGTTLLGFIVDGMDLGGSVDDGVATQTDAIFGITDPDDYSEASRGFGGGGGGVQDDFVCATSPTSFVFSIKVADGVDDFRAIVDYGDDFPTGLEFDFSTFPVAPGTATIQRGIRVGVDDPAVPGSGDPGEFGSVLGIPLTTADDPEVGFGLPFVPGQNVYVIRDTSGATFVDAVDVPEGVPSPGWSTLDTRVQNPAGFTDGPDGRLYAVGGGGGYAVIDPADGSKVESFLEDLTGTNIGMTDLPAQRFLYVLRSTAAGAVIDQIDVDAPALSPLFSISSAVLPNAVAMTDGNDGQLWILGSSGSILPVDVSTGPGAAVVFGAPLGAYVALTERDGDDWLYLLRDSGASAVVDRFNVVSGVVDFDFATVGAMSDPVSITGGIGGRLVLIGAGDGTAPIYAELDAVSGALLVSHACLDLDGQNVAITDRSWEDPAGPGEAGTDFAPLRVSDVDPSGVMVLIYGVACEATNHTIHFGPLTHAALAAYGYSGRDCGIGNTGSYQGFDPGPGSFFFVIVGDDGQVEGSYGTDRIGGVSMERPPDSDNGACPLPQDLLDPCAQ